MRITLCILKVIHQHYPSPSAWKPSLCLGQGFICSDSEAWSRPFSSPELLTLCTPGMHAHTRVPTVASGSVNLGFLLFLLFFFCHAELAHSSSHSAARLHAAIVPCPRGAVLGRGCSSQDGRPGFLAGWAPLLCPPTPAGSCGGGACCFPSLCFTSLFKHCYSKWL